ncbi:MAG: dTDP-glucose 4,6-dehydratase [bacterium]
MKKSILVTGGAGFIGSNFVTHLYNKYPDYKLIVLDALTYAGDIENLPVNISRDQDRRLSFWYGNVRNGELVDTLVSQSDMVVHFAAETHVTRSIYDNFLFFETDVLGTQTIANAVLKYKDRIERFIHISTSEVYGTAHNKLMDEQHPLLPMSPYASAKAGADRLVYSYWATYKLPMVIARPFNNYGPKQHLEKVIPRFITGVMLDEKLRVHGDGMSKRDFVYVEDTCKAVDLMMHAPEEKVLGEVFNIGSNGDRSILSIAKDVNKEMDCRSDNIIFVGNRPGQVIRHTSDIGKIKKVLGWEPEVNWNEGLKKTIEWYKSNRALWKKQTWMKEIPIITASGKRELH